MVYWLALSPNNMQVPGSNLPVSQGRSLWSLLPQSKDMKLKSTGCSKLPAGINVSANGILCLCISPKIDYQPVQGVPQCQLGLASVHVQLAMNKWNRKCITDASSRYSCWGKWVCSFTILQCQTWLIRPNQEEDQVLLLI